MKDNIGTTDRLISIFTYYTFGALGLAWLIVCAIWKIKIPKFTKYHIIQSIFISIIFYLITLLFGIAIDLMSTLPLIGIYVKLFVIYISQTPIYMGYSLIHYITFIFLTYFAVFALFGKYSYFPFISDMVKSNVEGM